MADIARLGFDIDSGGVKKGVVALEDIVDASDKAEKSSGGLKNALARLEKILASIERAVRDVESAVGRMAAGLGNARAKVDGTGAAASTAAARVEAMALAATSVSVSFGKMDGAAGRAATAATSMGAAMSASAGNAGGMASGLANASAKMDGAGAAASGAAARVEAMSLAATHGAESFVRLGGAAGRAAAATQGAAAAMNTVSAGYIAQAEAALLNLARASGVAGASVSSMASSMAAAAKAMNDNARAAGGASAAAAGLASQMGGLAATTALGAMRSLGSVLLGLLNPIGLVAGAVSALVVSGMQYIGSLISETETLDDRLRAHRDLISSIESAYGDALRGAKFYVSESMEVLEAKLRWSSMKLADDLSASLKKAIGGMQDTFTALDTTFGEQSVSNVRARFLAFKTAIDDLSAGLAAGTPNVRAFQGAVVEIANNDPTNQALQKLAQELMKLTESAASTEGALSAAQRAIAATGAAAISNAAAVAEFGKALSALSRISLPNLSPREAASAAHARALSAAQYPGDIEAADYEYSAALVRIAVEEKRIADERARRNSISRRGTVESRLDGPDGKKYDHLVLGANQYIAAQKLEAQALGMTEVEANTLRHTQELLNKAANDNIKLTPKQDEELRGLANAMAVAEEAARKAKEAFDFARDMVKGFITDLRQGLQNGESFWRSFGNAAMNVLDKIIATSILPDWDPGEDAWVVRPTRNPAAHFREVLTGNAVAWPLPASDLEALEDWHEWCTLKGLTYDRVHDYDASVLEVLSDIARAGRASPQDLGSRWTVVIDRIMSEVRGHISPRNSWGFSGKRTLTVLPDAFRVKFRDGSYQHRDAERVVPFPGFSGAPQVIEDLELPGITNPDLIWREARRRGYELLHRRDIYEANLDWEHLANTRGDPVRLSHDVLVRAQVAARVRTVSGTMVDLDETVTMEAGYAYACRFRAADGASVLHTVMTVEGTTSAIVLTSPGPMPQPGDLAMFGPAAQESLACIVKGVEIGDDLTAKLTLIDAAPQIETLTDAEVPPPWDGRIGIVVGESTVAPGVPVIIEVLSGVIAGADAVIVALAPGSGAVAPVSYDVDHRLAGAPSWLSVTIPASAGAAYIEGYTKGDDIEIRARATSGTDHHSDYTDIVAHEVGATDPAMQDVVSLTPAWVGPQVRFTWSLEALVADMEAAAGVRIRYGIGSGLSWGDLSDLHTGLLSVSPWVYSGLSTGDDHTFGAVAVTADGNMGTPVIAVLPAA